MLLAQGLFPPTLFAAYGNSVDDDLALAGGILLFLVIYLVGILLLEIFYLITMSKALEQCDPRSRLMPPGNVWMNFIPIYNLFSMFKVVNSVSDSLRREFRARDLRREGDFAKGLGVTFLVLWLVAAVVSRVEVEFVPLIGLAIQLVAIILWIVYWAKIAGYSHTLRQDAGRGDFRRDELDDNFGERFGERDRARNRGREDYKQANDDDRKRDYGAEEQGFTEQR